MKDPQAPSRNLLFESLRGLAALAVFVYHLLHNGFDDLLPFWAKYGWVGVNVFFALSGFLIARAIFSPPVFQLSAYARSRVRRILPAYLASLIILIGIQNTRYLVAPDWEKDLSAHLLLVHAWFGGGIMSSINGVYWTLSHEWTFYLLMGLAAPLLRKTRFGWPVILTLILVSFVARWGWITGRWTLPNGHLHPICVCDQFAFGILAAGICHHLTITGKALRNFLLIPLLLVGLALAAWGLHRYQIGFDSAPRSQLEGMNSHEEIFRIFSKWRSTFLTSNLLMSFGFGCLLLVAWLRGSLLTPFLKFTPLPWMGRVSYSTYLWHLPVILCLANLKRRAATSLDLERWLDHPAGFITAAFVLVYLLSWISYCGFEAPYLKEKPVSAS